MARHRAGYSGELLSEKLTVKLTESEKDEAAKRAAGAGIPLSTYARMRLTGGQVPKAVIGRDPSVLRELTNEIVRVGNNLNQLTKIAHQNGRIEQERALVAVCDKIVGALSRVIEL